MFKVKMYIRDLYLGLINYYYRVVLKMNLAKDVRFSTSAKLDKTYPKGINIDSGTYIAFNAVVLSHDFCRSMHCDTFIGKNCFIGAGAIILPGVKVGDNVIVGAGSLVNKDVPNNTIVAGNPAKVIKSDIKTKKFGVLY